MIVLIPVDDDGEDGDPIQLGQASIHVGRGAHNDLILDEEDQAASYEHASITVLDGKATVLCEPTANPTYIDGADIGSAPEEERQLQPGNILSFGKGKSIFRVQRIDTSASPRPSAPQKVTNHLRPRRPKPSVDRPARTAPARPDPRAETADLPPHPLSVQVFKGDQMVRQEIFHQSIIRVGRMRSSHLLLDDKSVSRTHAVIERTADEVLLIDLDSSSGTAVNGARIKKAVIHSGDQLDFGDARVVVSFTPLPATASAPPPVPAEASHLGPSRTEVLSPSDLIGLDGPRLLVRRDGVAREEYALGKPHTTIGRLPENDLQLDDGTVSGKHAMLVAEAGLFLVVDQRSTNGTYVNGEKSAGDSLQDGDVIQIGCFELVFVAPRPATAPRAPKTQVLSPEATRAMLAKAAGRRGRKP